MCVCDIYVFLLCNEEKFKKNIKIYYRLTEMHRYSLSADSTSFCFFLKLFSSHCARSRLQFFPRSLPHTTERLVKQPPSAPFWIIDKLQQEVCPHSIVWHAQHGYANSWQSSGTTGPSLSAAFRLLYTMIVGWWGRDQKNRQPKVSWQDSLLPGTNELWRHHERDPHVIGTLFVRYTWSIRRRAVVRQIRRPSLFLSLSTCVIDGARYERVKLWTELVLWSPRLSAEFD